MLKPLYKISSPNLVATSDKDWKDDVIDKIQADTEWNAIYDGDLYQNAFQMILELGNYLARKNAQSANNQLKEKFLNQSYSPQAINDNLVDMRISLQQATGAYAKLNATINNDLLNETIVIPKFEKVYGANPNGERVTFEIINKDEDGKFDYFNNIIVEPTVEFRSYFQVDVYAGETFSYEYDITPEMKDNFVISLSNTNIIDDSIRVFYITSAGARVECIKTDSFVVEPSALLPYFPNGVPHYIIKYAYDGSAKILFGDANFGGAFEDAHIGQKLRVYGRSGGGSRTNCNANMINYNLEILISGGTYLSVTLTNPSDATGGVDREDIYQAQLFAPYRYGRDKTIVDAQDAQSMLYSYVEKHEISTPQYSDDPEFENVPILHAYHRIVPIRNFANLVLPEVTTDDTATTYNTKFLAALQTFLNVEGAHSEAVVGEKVTDFVYPDLNDLTFISHIPAYSYPLSASLTAYAYDVDGRIVDSITWNSNYITDQKTVGYSNSTQPAQHAIVTSTEFSTINIVNNTFGRNDYLVFSIDYDVFSFIFTITMTTGIKTYEAYAEELQAAIVAAINANPTAAEKFGSYINWEFVSAQANTSNPAMGSVVFTSPSYGINSKIEFRDNGTLDTVTDTQYNIYKFLGVEKKIYRPATQTGLVFDTSTFKYNDNIVTLNFKNTVYEVADTQLYADLGVVINHATATNPIIEVVLKDDDGYLQKLFEDYTMTAVAYNSGNVEIDRVTFNSISSISDTDGTASTNTVFFTSGHTFNYEESKVTLSLLTNINIPVYAAGYPTIYSVVITRLQLVSPGVYQKDPEYEPLTFLEESGNYTFDITSSTGAILTLQLTSEQNNTLTIGDSIVVEFIHRDTVGVLTVVESFKVISIVDSNTLNIFTDKETTTSTVDMTYLITGLSGNRYERGNAILRFKFNDGALDGSTTYYDQGFADFAYIIFNFHRKSYDTVAIDYEPNPYFPEGEAEGLISLLNNSAKRLIGMENIIKPITFEPRPITVSIVVKRGYGVAQAKDAVSSQLSLDFEYANDNYEHTVGSLITHQLIKNSINKVASQFGIIDVTISNAEDTDDIEDTSTIYKYKFISADLYEKLRLQENSYSQISGISALYKITITALSEELRA